MRATFVDPSLQQRFDEDGFVVISLLGEAEVADLRGFWAGLDTTLHGFHSTIHEPSVAYKRRVDRHLKEVLSPALHGCLDRYRPVIANFVAKAPGPESEMPAHLDWSMVDETTYTSVGVWSPLTDTDDTNGALGLVRASPRALRALRGTPHFPNFDDLATIADRFADEDRVLVPLRAGQAVIYDHRTVHFSPPNCSDRERVAVNLALVPAEAGTFHHHLHPDGRVERFQVDDPFYVEHDITQVPRRGLSLGHVPREFAILAPARSEADDAGRRATFVDPDLQLAFERDGYVRIPLVSTDDAAELRATWEQLGLELGSGFHASIYGADRDIKAEADRGIKQVLEPALRSVLDDHDVFLGNFVVKQPDETSEVGPHQDWTFVDERHYSSITVWCPLTATDEHNGTLRVVPGSHRWVQNPRGTPINAFPFPYQDQWGSILTEDSIALSARLGEAIIVDNRLIHCSAPNWSDTARVVAGCGAKPSQADLVHLFRDGDTAEVYRIDDPDFYLDLIPGDRPTGVELVDRFPVVETPVSAEEFDRLLGRRRVGASSTAEEGPATETAPEGDVEPAEPAPPPDTQPGDAAGVAVGPEPTVHVPGANPTFQRRLWNLLTPAGRHRVRRAWATLPGPVRRRVDPRND